MQTHVISSGANFQLVLTLNSKKSIRADTMFPQAQVCGIVERFEILSKLCNHLVVLLSFTAFSFILAFQFAFWCRLSIFEFANGAMETDFTIATFVSEKKKNKRK
jgi:hypothetical protein